MLLLSFIWLLCVTDRVEVGIVSVSVPLEVLLGGQLLSAPKARSQVRSISKKQLTLIVAEFRKIYVSRFCGHFLYLVGAVRRPRYTLLLRRIATQVISAFCVGRLDFNHAALLLLNITVTSVEKGTVFGATVNRLE